MVHKIKRFIKENFLKDLFICFEELYLQNVFNFFCLEKISCLFVLANKARIFDFFHYFGKQFAYLKNLSFFNFEIVLTTNERE